MLVTPRRQPPALTFVALVLVTACGASDSNVDAGGVLDASQDAAAPTPDALPAADAAPCPEGWVELGAQCVQLVLEPAGWAGARSDCQTRSADLAELNSAADLVAGATLAGQNVWVGAYDAVSEGMWLWSDGSPLAETLPWAEGQPDDAGGDEDCAVLSAAGELSDASCGMFLPYLCATLR